MHGRYPGKVEVGDGGLVVDGATTKVLGERDPAALPWGEMKVDFVVESTGVFATQEACMKHVAAGAKKVLLTVPPKEMCIRDRGRGGRSFRRRSARSA